MGQINKIEKAVEILKNGGIIAYPTDTVCGLGANIFDDQAIEKIFKAKGRDFNKPLSVAMADFDTIKKIAYVSKEQEKILRKFLPGPYTFVLRKKKIVSDLITGKSGLVGIRMPDNKKALAIIKQAGFPIISTSANLSGKSEVVKTDEIKVKVDFILKGVCRHKKPSTIVDLVNKKILRLGAGKLKDDIFSG